MRHKEDKGYTVKRDIETDTRFKTDKESIGAEKREEKQRDRETESGETERRKGKRRRREQMN